MTALFYGLIVLFATILGATTGAGGGAIIKPLFDLIGIDNASTIGIYSTIAVFSMCLSSLYKHSKSGQGFDSLMMLTLAIGSATGGYLGERIFKVTTENISNSKVTMTQAILLFVVICAVLLFTEYRDCLPKVYIRHKVAIVVFSFIVGVCSIFLGIGGGPLNVIVLLGLMSMTMKESIPYSIGMIFFAQIPKILMIIFATPMERYNLATVPVIAVTAVLGGFIGTRLHRHLTERQVRMIYRVMMVGLLATSGVNIFRNL